MTGPLIDPRSLADIIGRESDLGRLSTALGDTVGAADVDTIGVVHVTCADEAQHLVVEEVQELLVEPYATPLASGVKSAFRLINLGAYVEPGAIGLAEEHWAGAHGPDHGPKLMVVRVDAHVGVDHGPSGDPLYGHFLRFGKNSVACGALAAVLNGQPMPGDQGFVDEHARAHDIRELFPEHLRMLAAAICRAELSAADCLAQIGDHHDESLTEWLVVAAVTMNHPEGRTSMLTSVAVVQPDGHVEQAGLGTEVAAYEIGHGDGRLAVVAAAGAG